MPAGKLGVQFPGKSKAPVNRGIAGFLSAKDHPDGHHTPSHSTACATGSPNPDGKSRRHPDDLIRVTEPEGVVDGLDDRFGAVELPGTVILLSRQPDLLRINCPNGFLHITTSGRLFLELDLSFQRNGIFYGEHTHAFTKGILFKILHLVTGHIAFDLHDHPVLRNERV